MIAYLIPVGVVIISLTVAAAAALDGCALEVRIDATPTMDAQEDVANDRRLPNRSNNNDTDSPPLVPIMDNENAAALEPLRINRMAERNLVIVSVFCFWCGREGEST